MSADYVRAIEAHVCQKNDGHLIRIVGPAFEVVCGWERQGIPLKVALRGVDRYFERYYRNGPKRRPVRVEFCDTDVLELFDEWRRAVGVAARAGARESLGGDHAPEAQALSTGVTADQDAPSSPASRGPSLPAHLERVLLKLSSARAGGRLGDGTDAVIDAIAAELDRARAAAGGVRGDARKALIDRLATLDRDLLAAAETGLADAERTALRRDAEADLAAFRGRMAAEAYEAAVTRALAHRLRERLGLPVVAFA